MDPAILTPTLSPPISLPISPSIPSETAEHLRRQVHVIDNLYEQHQHSLSEPERQWIQNTIWYARHVLNTCSEQYEQQQGQSTMHRRLHTLHAFTMRTRQSRLPAAFWNSHFLIALQNLNTAMSMLSWCTHNNSVPDCPLTAVPNQSATQKLPENELSTFLNRRRVGRNSGTTTILRQSSPPKGKAETTIAELRATNSLLCSTNRAVLTGNQSKYPGSGDLPLSLVETVEKWRQTAEDALKAAMLRYFEHEELLKGTTKNNIAEGQTTNVKPFEDSTEALKLVNDKRGDQHVLDIATTGSRRRSSAHISLPSTLGSRSSNSEPVPHTSSSLSGPSVSPATTATAVSPSPSHRSLASPPQPTFPSEPYPTPCVTSTATKEEPNFTLDPQPSQNSASTKPISHPSPCLRTQSGRQSPPASLLFCTSSNPHSITPDVRNVSAVSLSGPGTTIDTGQIPTCQRLDSQSHSELQARSIHDLPPTGQKKSRGRAWLERQAAMYGD